MTWRSRYSFLSSRFIYFSLLLVLFSCSAVVYWYVTYFQDRILLYTTERRNLQVLKISFMVDNVYCNDVSILLKKRRKTDNIWLCVLFILFLYYFFYSTFYIYGCLYIQSKKFIYFWQVC